MWLWHAGSPCQLDLQPHPQAPRDPRHHERRPQVPWPAWQGPPLHQGSPLPPRHLEAQQHKGPPPLPVRLLASTPWQVLVSAPLLTCKHAADLCHTQHSVAAYPTGTSSLGGLCADACSHRRCCGQLGYLLNDRGSVGISVLVCKGMVRLGSVKLAPKTCHTRTPNCDSKLN